MKKCEICLNINGVTLINDVHLNVMESWKENCWVETCSFV